LASYPKIDSPCPMRWTALPESGRDFCTRCEKRVYNLDRMSTDERKSFLSKCRGPVCVAYSVSPRPVLSHTIASIGVAAALMAMPIVAGADGTTAGTATASQSASGAPIQSVVVGGIEATGQGVPLQVEAGGINNDSSVSWVEDPISSIPELPTVDASAFLERAPRTQTPDPKDR
jgi:hypothetical protein